MSNLTINNVEVHLTTNKGAVFADTKDIAEVFGKSNSNVMVAVDNILNLKPDLRSKLKATTYTADNGKSNKMYALDRDLFNLVVLGFTGSKALDYKIAFVEAFNAMEQELTTIYEDRLKLQLAEKDEKIRQLETEKKLCIMYEDDFSSVRGIAQRSEFSEKEIRDWLKNENILTRVPVATWSWEVKTPSFIVKEDKKGTPILHMPSILRLMREDLN